MREKMRNALGSFAMTEFDEATLSSSEERETSRIRTRGFHWRAGHVGGPTLDPLRLLPFGHSPQTNQVSQLIMSQVAARQGTHFSPDVYIANK